MAPPCSHLAVYKLVVLISLIALCLNLQPSRCEIVYVSPSLPCFVQSQPCLSLDQLVTNSGWVDSYTRLIFLPGIHRLRSNSKLFISNISFLQLTSESSFTESQSSIACENDTSVDIYNVNRVLVSGLSFFGCKFSVHFVQQLLIDNSSLQGDDNSETALQLVVTNAYIINSSFLFNRVGTCAPTHTTYTGLMLVGGAILAVGLSGNKRNNITITGSRFESNGAERGGAIFAQNCKVTIFNTSFIDNHASAANASFKEMLCDKHAFAMQEIINTLVTSFKFNAPGNISYSDGGAIASVNSDLGIDSCIFVNSSSGTGGGALDVQSTSEGCTVHVNNSTFYNCYANNHGGVLAALPNMFIIVENCTINNSRAYYGGFAFLWNSNLIIKKKYSKKQHSNVGWGSHKSD